MRANRPVDMADDQRGFDYFLMHGSHPAWPQFILAEQSQEQRSALVELVARYLAEFYDPGLGMMAHPDRQRIRERARRFASEANGAPSQRLLKRSE